MSLHVFRIDIDFALFFIIKAYLSILLCRGRPAFQGDRFPIMGIENGLHPASEHAAAQETKRQ